MVTKKNLYNPGRVLDICAKNEGDPTIGLGGVWPQTDIHTHKQRTYGYYSIYIYTLSAKMVVTSLENSIIANQLTSYEIHLRLDIYERNYIKISGIRDFQSTYRYG